MKEVIEALWVISGAYLCNAAPLLLSSVYGKEHAHPLDMGRRFLDGRRILGDGKTVEGFLVGVICGIAFGLTGLFILSDNLALLLYKGASIGLFTMLGDIIGSFLKRRLGFRCGEHAPLLDQLTFIATCILLIKTIYPQSLICVDYSTLLVVFLATYVIHTVTNVIAFVLGIKTEPW